MNRTINSTVQTSQTALSQHDPVKLQGLILPDDGHCFHCGEPLPTPPFIAHVLGENRLMCCLGCQLAAQSIVEAGLEQYYLDRSEISRTASLPSELSRLQAYDHDDVKAQFVYQEDGLSVAQLSVSGLRCAACGWLIESRLAELSAVKRCQVNLTNQRMQVVWNEEAIAISDILHRIHQIGYDAKPYRQDTHEAMLARQNKAMMIRLGIAALGAMQAMMFAVALYFGEYRGMQLLQRDFLRWVSLFVSVPVFFYAGLPFYQSAYSALRLRQVNMDVPVSIALVITFVASFYATVTGTGQTYYDSVSMFVFFLLAGRMVEHNARLKAVNMSNDLVVIEPIVVRRLGQANELTCAYLEQLALSNAQHNTQQNRTQQSSTQQNNTQQNAQIKALTDRLVKNILAKPSAGDKITTVFADEVIEVTDKSLQIGDVIEIDAGMQIIADGLLLSDHASVSQSLLTGESDLIHKHQGDDIIGGSQNDSQPFKMLVTALPQNSQISIIDRLMMRAMSEKPQIAQKADQWARWFVSRVLVLSLLVFFVWYWIDPAQAIWATVAVLVATCPCALSLATPIALTVATNRLAQLGFVNSRGHTLETLANVTHVAFDKTGTLTMGKPNLINVILTDVAHRQGLDKMALVSKAAALEVGSRHPIAHALLTAAHQQHLPKTDNLQHHAGGGVEAMIEGGLYRIGHVAFVLDKHDADDHHLAQAIKLANPNDLMGNHQVMLSQKIDNQWQLLAWFDFNDTLRPQAKDSIQKLQRLGLQVLMLTGDPNDKALGIAQELGMDKVAHGLSPTDKVSHLQAIQKQGGKVWMIGDGINDAPVLAAADVSTAMVGAADLAQVSSDSLLLQGDLAVLVAAKMMADSTQRKIKQNLTWAIGYNTMVLLPAGLGYVPPWLAAIGMSVSSLVVVVNALRR